MQHRDAPQIVSFSPAASHKRYMGSVGHVVDVKYDFTFPGGPNSASWTLQKPPKFRDIAMDPGRIIQVNKGTSVQWNGSLDEPSPDDQNGWSMTAHGSGALGNQFCAVYSNWNNPDDSINQAIARGLTWKNSGISGTSGLWLGDQVDSASQTITDYLNSITVQGALAWVVDKRDNTFDIIPLPTVPDRILVVTSPVPRAVSGDFNSLFLKYQITDDNQSTGAAATYGLINTKNSPDIARHGTWEDYYDLSDNGTMSSGSVTANGNNILSRFNRASFAGSFVARPGQILTMGGSPIDLATENAGHVYRVVLADYGYGGEVTAAPITFIGGTYAFDYTAQTGTITPFQNVANSLQTLLAAVFPTKASTTS